MGGWVRVGLGLCAGLQPELPRSTDLAGRGRTGKLRRDVVYIESNVCTSWDRREEQRFQVGGAAGADRLRECGLIFGGRDGDGLPERVDVAGCDLLAVGQH